MAATVAHAPTSPFGGHFRQPVLWVFIIAFVTSALSGCGSAEAPQGKARLARDGQNVLTPPKKKSALRKVRRGPFSWFSFFAVQRCIRSRAAR